MMTPSLMAEHVAELTEKQWDRVKYKAVVKMLEHYSRHSSYYITIMAECLDAYEEYSFDERYAMKMDGAAPRGLIGLKTEEGKEYWVFYHKNETRI